VAAAFLREKKKPVLLIGSKLRAAGAEKEAVELADALGCSIAVMAAAKSFFPEGHPQFVGIYWGEISTSSAQTIVDWSDAVVCIGTIFNGYSTVGWTAMPSGPNVLSADQNRVYRIQRIDGSRLETGFAHCAQTPAADELTPNPVSFSGA
jgi:pyruvate decarboxylase